MMGGPPPGFGRPGDATDKLRVPKPNSLREVPEYLRKLLGGFFSRLFYIFRLVWDAKPWILFAMIFMAVFNGVRPVIDAKIASLLLTSLGDAAVALINGTEYAFSHIMQYLLIQFGFIFLANILTQTYNMILRIAGELVTNHIKMKMLYKARTIDLASFDQPEFYEKMENASREAGTRPIQIMRSTFSIVSSMITMVSFIAALLHISKTAPVLIIVLSLPSAIITFVYRRKNFLYMRRRSKARRQMAYYSNTLTNKDLAKEIRLFDLSDTLINRYKETFRNYYQGIKKLIVSEGTWHIALSAVSSGVNCYLFLYIAQMVYRGLLKIGDYSFYTGALKSISSGFTSLIDTTASVYEGTL
ncbi:MAG: ABC transporter ATP-binding protein, partial [Lachnospiraceae bacterium]|nr:ABC transporter ATP-binding protein [Lachnospiraceae bacterium]